MKTCEILSFRRGVVEVVALLGCCASQDISLLLNFRDNCLTREDGTDIVPKCRQPNTILNPATCQKSDHTDAVKADVFAFQLFRQDTQTSSPGNPVSTNCTIKTTTYSLTCIKLLCFLGPDNGDSAVIYPRTRLKFCRTRVTQKTVICGYCKSNRLHKQERAVKHLYSFTQEQVASLPYGFITPIVQLRRRERTEQNTMSPVVTRP